MIQRIDLAGATYFYTSSEKGVSITGYEGKKIELSIPDSIEGIPVYSIAKKAFFNTPGLYRIYLPDSLEEMGDWAFAHCRELEEVYIPQKEYVLGKALFMDCESLKRICLMPTSYTHVGYGESEQMNAIRGFGSLLASVCGILDAGYLFQTTKVDDVEWLSLWDARMLTILREDDMEGYTKLLLCGEEDYGSRENNLDFFLGEKRKRKVRLAFLRLLYDKELAEDNKKELQEYLRNHTKNCNSEETWLVLKSERGEDMAYINLFLELGCLTLENYDHALKDLGEEHPQMKAVFMRYKDETLGGADFFDSLSLDL